MRCLLDPICKVEVKGIPYKYTEGWAPIRILNFIVALLWIVAFVSTRCVQGCTERVPTDHQVIVRPVVWMRRLQRVDWIVLGPWLLSIQGEMDSTMKRILRRLIHESQDIIKKFQNELKETVTLQLQDENQSESKGCHTPSKSHHVGIQQKEHWLTIY